MVAPVQFLVKQETKLSVEVKEKRNLKRDSGSEGRSLKAVGMSVLTRDT